MINYSDMENLDDFYFEDSAIELEQQLIENLKLKEELQQALRENSKSREMITILESFNYKLSQNLEYETIQCKNLTCINNRLNIALKGLIANKQYIQDLLHKKCKTSMKINKLVATIKDLQRMLKNKNLLIKRISYQNDKLLEKAARIIKESYSI